ncbi:MAG: hypothetical protein ACXABY_28675 [Candidatus Thorarchaeota archaeon]|jgi:hypothetical protein
MRFPWSRRKKRKQQPVDLKTLSKKIISRRMKADPAFGEEIAMRELNYLRDEPESAMFDEGGGRSDFKTFMKDFKQMKDFMHELKEGGGHDNKSSVLADILNSQTAQIFANNLASAVKQMQPGQMPMQVQEQQPQLKEKPQLKLMPEQNVLSLNDVRSVMEKAPTDAVNTLVELNDDWLPVLASSTPESILSQIEVFLPTNADLQPIFEHLATNIGKKWLSGCILEAQKRLEPSKPENTGD